MDRKYTVSDLNQCYRTGGLSILQLLDKAIKAKNFDKNDIITLIENLIKTSEANISEIEIIKKHVDNFCS